MSIGIRIAAALGSIGIATASLFAWAGTEPATQSPDMESARTQAKSQAMMHVEERVASRTPVKMSAVLSPEKIAEKIGTLPNFYYWLTVPGVNFQPKDNSTVVTYAGGGCVYTNGGQVIAQLMLPDHSIVQYMRIFYNRNNVGQSSTAYLTKYNPSTAFPTDVFSVSASGTGLASDLSAVQNETVDYYTYGYNAIWVNSGASNNLLCGVRVAYYMAADGTYTSINPCRVIDTRSSPPDLSGTPRNVQVTGTCGIPAGATSVTANVTVANTTASAFMALYPQGTAWGGTAAMNWVAGDIIGNAQTIPLSAGGGISGFVSGGTAALILDVTGYFY